MKNVLFLETGTEVSVPSGTTLLEAVRMAGLTLESPCNQTGVCGKCRVRLAGSSLSGAEQPEQSPLTLEQQKQGWVLACHTDVRGNLEVVEVPRVLRDNGSVLQDGLSRECSHEPAVYKRFDSAAGTTTVYQGEKCIGTEAGDTSESLFGVVVDIGTTTIVASLVDLVNGGDLATVSGHNPQAAYAQDVLSRITFASKGEGLNTLHAVLRNALNKMIEQLCQQSGIAAESIYELVFSGNTCMLHLACGVNPKPLGQYPYTPEIYGHHSIPAHDLGIAVSPCGSVYLPPVLSAYVGADITSGILSLRMHERKTTSLLIDIGTNGEIVLARNGLLTATSTAAGPALEGMNISCGTCAGVGAIDSVTQEEGEGFSFTTIGDKEPCGLCGSGLIDLVATLCELDVIEPNGRFADSASLPEKLASKLDRQDGRRLIHLTDRVSLSQKDVRQVQLAKGAIRAGIDELLEYAGLAPADIDEVMIAGAFGFHLSTESLVALKILPHEFVGKVAYVGNTSRTGGRVFLTNRPSRDEMAALVERVSILELSGQENFERRFVGCLSF